MAKVFTPEQIAQDKFPNGSDFPEAASCLLNYLEENLFCEESVDGGLIYGSTTTGGSNIRSDLDALISLKAYDAHIIAGDLRLIFRHIEQEWNIPVEPIVYNSTRLAAGEHTIDPIFATHLHAVDASKWGVGSNPLDKLAFKETSRSDIFERYALHKESKFKKAALSAEPGIDYRVFQRALEIPRALGRKALAVVDEDFDPQTATETQVAAVLKDVTSWMTNNNMLNIIQTNDTYNALLLETIGSTATQIDQYAQWLGKAYRPTILNALGFTTSLMADVKNHVNQ